MSASRDAPAGRTFAADYRVRFDEAGPDGLMRTSTLLRYAQDVAWRHSEERGFDRAWYADRGLGWVVRSLSLDVLGSIGVGEILRLSTRVIGHRRIWARRLAEARRVRDGVSSPEPVARVITDWVILDGRGRPVRIPTDFGLDFASPEVRDEIQHVEAPAGEPTASFRIRVRPHDLDPVGHVNNAAYLDWLEEALLAASGPAAESWSAAVPRSAALEYLASAGPGDSVEVGTWRDGRAWRATMTVSATDVLRAAGVAG